jgi:hypothetical protein
MAEKVGFPGRKHGNGKTGESCPARPIRAGDPSHRVVTRDALDVARFIAGMAAQFEAMAIAAHLDQVAFFLGIAKAESEIAVRTSAVAEAQRAEEESYEPVVGPRRSR